MRTGRPSAPAAFSRSTLPETVLAACAADLLRSELPLQSKAIEYMAHRSVWVYRRLCEDSDLAVLCDRDYLFEVPFSFHDAESPSVRGAANIVTGTIDCLARDRENRVTVLEFKTGVPRPEHRRQLESYVKAARVMFPDALIDGQLVYSPTEPNRL